MREVSDQMAMIFSKYLSKWIGRRCNGRCLGSPLIDDLPDPDRDTPDKEGVLCCPRCNRTFPQNGIVHPGGGDGKHTGRYSRLWNWLTTTETGMLLPVLILLMLIPLTLLMAAILPANTLSWLLLSAGITGALLLILSFLVLFLNIVEPGKRLKVITHIVLFIIGVLIGIYLLPEG